MKMQQKDLQITSWCQKNAGCDIHETTKSLRYSE